MTNPAAEARAKAQEQWPGATVIGRGRTFIKHQHPINLLRYMSDYHIGPIHYGSDEDQEIDTTWESGVSPTDDPWLWKMVKAGFNVYAGPGTMDFDAGQILRYVHPNSGEDVTFQAQQLQWTNDLGQIEAIADPQKVGHSAIIDDTIFWDGAYGPGLDFRWQAQTARLAKYLTIQSQVAIGSPPQFIIDGGNPVLKLPFIFQKSIGVDIYINDILWNEKSNNPQITSGEVEFRLNATGETLWHFKRASVRDASGGGQPDNIETKFKAAAQNLFVEVLVPWGWLESATYPVEIDPTIDEQIGASSDDAYESSAGVVSIIIAEPNVDDVDKWHGLRWQGIILDNVDSIDVSYIDVYFFHNAYDEPYVTVDFQDSIVPSSFNTIPYNISNRTGTTETVLFSVANAGIGWEFTPSLNTIITELEASYDYSSGLAMVARMTQPDSQPARDCGIYNYDGDTALCPKLHIEYTETSNQDDLTATGITANPIVGTPVVEQIHALTSVVITTNPVVETPDVGQEHALGAVNITADPVVGTPVAGHIHVLDVVAITVNPVLDTSSIGQEHVLDATGITANSVLDTPTLITEGEDNLVANDITVNPVLDTPSVGQEHVLDVTGITANPVLDMPSIGGQEHVLTAVGITANMVVGTPVLTTAGSGTTYSVKQTGGDYPTLNAALAAVSTDDTISIEGVWTIDDATACTVAVGDNNIIIKIGDSSAAHPGYWDTSTNHYRLVVSSGPHCITLSADNVRIDGLAIKQSGGASSAEGIRVDNSAINTIENCLITNARLQIDQDGIYSYHADSPTIIIKNCIIWDFIRRGIGFDYYSAATGATIYKINSCIIWNNGSGSEPLGGGIVFYSNNQFVKTLDASIHNTICIGNVNLDIAQCGGTGSRIDYSNITINVSYSIDSDSSIGDTGVNDNAGNLNSRTATDDTDPGAGDWVIFEDITTTPYDLRLVDNVENDAQDAHIVNVAEGLVIPIIDIVGTTRPQNIDYDIGSFEISAGDVNNLTATGITANPVLDTPSVGQEHVLDATGITANPVLDTPSVGQEHVLDATGITANPVLDTPSVGQEHVLDVTGITANPVVDTPILSTEGEDNLVADDITVNPVLDTPSVGQEHVLVSVDITANPVVDTPILSTEGEDNLVADDIIANPVLDTPSIGQEHVLDATGITANPVLDTSSVGQEHVLDATGITANPVVDTSSLGQIHVLDINDIFTTPVLSTSTLGQEHILSATGIIATPVLETPILSTEGVHGLAAQDITVTPGLGTPELGQTHVLSATDISTIPIVGIPILTVIYHLNATQITVISVLDTPMLGQTHALTASGILTIPVLDTPTLGQTHALTVSEISTAPVLDTPELGSIYALTADGILTTPQIGTPEIGQIHILSGMDIVALPTLDISTLGQTHVLTAFEISTTPVLGTPSYDQYLVQYPPDIEFSAIYPTADVDAVYPTADVNAIYPDIEISVITEV